MRNCAVGENCVKIIGTGSLTWFECGLLTVCLVCMCVFTDHHHCENGSANVRWAACTGYKRGCFSIDSVFVLVCALCCGLAVPSLTVRNGVLARVKDSDVSTPVLELSGTNCASNTIACPGDRTSSLSITLPIFNMFVKAVRLYWQLVCVGVGACVAVARAHSA